MMDIRRNYETGAELNRMRHAAIIAQAEQEQIIRQSRGVQARNWKQRLEAAFADLAQLMRTGEAHRPSSQIKFGDKASSASSIGFIKEQKGLTT